METQMNKITSLVFSTILLTTPIFSAHAAEYVIDGTNAGMHAAINFKASHIGISNLWGRFNEFSGSFTYDADNIEASKIEVTINPASVDTNHEARDEHLKSSDFMNVETFPDASFVSTAFKDLGHGRVEITGDFNLHGVTREIVFEAVRTGEGETPFGDYRVGFASELTLDMADFGINVGELALVLAIEGVRQYIQVNTQTSE